MNNVDLYQLSKSSELLTDIKVNSRFCIIWFELLRSLVVRQLLRLPGIRDGWWVRWHFGQKSQTMRRKSCTGLLSSRYGIDLPSSVNYCDAAVAGWSSNSALLLDIQRPRKSTSVITSILLKAEQIRGSNTIRPDEEETDVGLLNKIIQCKLRF